VTKAWSSRKGVPSIPDPPGTDGTDSDIDTDITGLAIPAGLHEVHHTSLDLPTGRIDVAHPRGTMELLYEQNFMRGSGTEPPYWAHLWPCGVQLARAVADLRPAGARVLELGCGLALPSLAAALGGARVRATDQAAGALAFAAYNARRNRVPLEVATCDWADPAAALAGAPWDLVLAADVLYRHSGLDALLALLPRLVGRGGEIWIADQARPPAQDFLDACARWATISTTATGDPEVTVHRLRPRERNRSLAR
jgi:predicted nicotinamide N-methyase